MQQLDQRVKQAVDSQRAWADVVELSKMDRTSGSDGDYRAVAYVERQLRDFGIPFNTHEFASYISWPGEARLKVLSPEAREIDVKSHAFSGNTPPEGLKTELVFIERGDLEDYRGKDVAGKVVLVEGPLGLVMPERVFNAQRVGAAGILMIAEHDEGPGGDLHEMIVTPVWGTPDHTDLADIPNLPAVSIRRRDGRALRGLLESGAVVVEMHGHSETRWRKLKLPVAEIRAEGNPEAEDFVLLAGHLDSWYLGTTDNATGDAVLLELARVLHGLRGDLRRSVRVAWWPGHSTGRYSGSSWYADNFWTELDRHCVGVCIVDSPGVRGATVQRIRSMDELRDFNLQRMSELGQDEVNLLYPVKAGDQSFWGVGVSSMSLNSELPTDHPDRAPVGGSGGGWWWHTPEDTIDKGDPDVVARDAWVIGAVIASLTTDPVLPLRFGRALSATHKHLADWQSKAGGSFDLGPALLQAEALAARARRVDEALGAAGEGASRELNRALLGISRALNPVLYTRAGRFKQDRAVPFPFLPGLQEIGELKDGGEREGFLLTHLVRERNRIQDALRAVERELRALEGALA